MSGNERLYIKIASEILEKIQNKEIKVGSRIPPERKLSEDLNVSRTVIREAMVYLELLGIAEIKKGSGVYVINDQPIQLADELPDVTPYEVTIARRALESQLAALAAEHATDELILELSNNINLMKSATFLSTAELRKSVAVDADMQFHKIIANASHNPLLIKFHEELMKHHMGGTMWNRLNMMADEPAERGIWANDHTRIFEAIKARDPNQAFLEMERHLNNVIDEIT